MLWLSVNLLGKVGCPEVVNPQNAVVECILTGGGGVSKDEDEKKSGWTRGWDWIYLGNLCK